MALKATHVLRCSASLAAYALIVPPAHAQVAPEAQESVAAPQTSEAAVPQAPEAAAGASADSGDIVVTARRRAESLQTVPVAVTAFTNETLTRNNIQATTDLQRVTPGVIFVGAGSSANTTFSIRGQGKDVVGPGLPSVISYFNEVPLPSWGSVLPTFDVSSVQILKGPQGTLFGRNTTGGAVLVYSAPVTDKLEGYGQTTLGRYSWRDFQGAINLPITEGIGLRIAGQHSRRDGYQKDIGNSGDGANLHSESLRATLKLQPFDALTNVTVYDRYHQRTNGDGYVAFGVTSPFPLYRFIPGFNCGTSPSCDVDLALAQQRARGLRTIDSDVPNVDRNLLQGISNTTTLKVGDVTIKNIFGWRDTKVRQQQNTDGLNLAVLNSRGFRNDRQISDELQFSGSLFQDRLQYLMGGFYLDLKPTGPTAFALDVFDSARQPDSNPFATISNNLYSDRSKAVFGNLSFQLLDGLKLNGGLRHTWDTEGVCAAVTTVFSADPIGSLAQCRQTPGFFESRVKFDATTYTVGVDYQVTSKVFSYVTVRRGYRAGGINTPSFAPLLSPYQFYSPQTVDDVELGLKTRWNVGQVRGRFNVAAFRGKFKNLQRQITSLPPNFDGDNNPQDDPSNTSLIINGAKARVQGVEVDGVIEPVTGLSINYGVSYLDAKYTSQVTPAIFAGSAGTLDRFPSSPKWSYTIAGRYELPFDISGAKVAVSADYYHVDDYLSGVVTVPSYGIANAYLDVSNIARSPISATLFVTNLTNKLYFRNSNINGSSPGFASFSLGEPRIYGVRLRYAFGN